MWKYDRICRIFLEIYIASYEKNSIYDIPEPYLLKKYLSGCVVIYNLRY